MELWLFIVCLALLFYIVQLVVILLSERMNANKAAAWIFISMILPVAGFAAYWIAERDFKRHKRLRSLELSRLQEAKAISDCVSSAGELNKQWRKRAAEGERLMAALSAISQRAVTRRNRVEVLTNGESLFASLLANLKRAEHHIHMDYYTIRNDGIGSKVLDVLTERAGAGVEVRVLYDGVGSWKLGDDFLIRLQASGGRTACFSPPRSAMAARQLNYRNHSKIVVIDGRIGYVGGMNIGDEYLGRNPKLGFWRDTQLRLEGDSVYFLQELFMKHWAYAAGESLPFDQYTAPHSDPNLSEDGENVLIVASGPDSRKEPIMETVFAAVNSARSRIYMTTPYFIPDSALMTAFMSAARAGVDVRLIIPGIADTQLVLWGTLSYMEPLLAAGVKVYRYGKGFIHAKVLIIDDLLAAVGTANMDMRSLHNNFEQNAILFDERTLQRLVHDFQQDLKDSRQVDPDRFANRSRLEKAKEACGHLLSPLL
ncbi:cardiolipin synthase [Paenibacillus protaetiae]|uniref:cardiolipin synthase n=1 Tax=Paenibacillus protaetiae TaxID=2509456 RepID=UPI0013ECAFF0|nr:cardiolipin synthase [Paenibacillus protaetiae]